MPMKISNHHAPLAMHQTRCRTLDYCLRSLHSRISVMTYSKAAKRYMNRLNNPLVTPSQDSESNRIDIQCSKVVGLTWKENYSHESFDIGASEEFSIVGYIDL